MARQNVVIALESTCFDHMALGRVNGVLGEQPLNLGITEQGAAPTAAPRPIF